MYTDEIDGYDDVDVPLSAIEHYSYCPRQCALIHVEQTYDENVFTMRGALAHERVHSGDDAPNRGVRSVRSIPLWSERLRVRGKADLVEFHGKEETPFPVEYKVGRRHGAHADLQLCAQALCLEEMLSVVVPAGAIFYHATRSRHDVEFTDALREQTTAMISAIHVLLRRQEIPVAPNDSRCPKCSLINVCLPSVVGEAARLRGLQGVLFRPWEVSDSDV